MPGLKRGGNNATNFRVNCDKQTTKTNMAASMRKATAYLTSGLELLTVMRQCLDKPD